jgi:hypothetical protein
MEEEGGHWDLASPLALTFPLHSNSSEKPLINKKEKFETQTLSKVLVGNQTTQKRMQNTFIKYKSSYG